MQYAVFIPNFGSYGHPQAVMQMAQAAEAAGWDALFVWDHIARDWPVELVDPWIALAAASTVTSRIKLGTMVTPVPRRRPWQLAKQIASLDHLSNGRMILGAGIGSGRAAEWDTFGEELDPVMRGQMLDEGLAIIDGLWREKDYHFEGKHYTVQPATLLPQPVQQPRPPIWIGGGWPSKAPMRRAARWDGVFPLLDRFGDDPADLTAALRECVAFVREERGDDTPFDVATVGVPTSGEDAAHDAAITAQFAEAGATWWLENIAPWRFGVDWQAQWPAEQMLQRVQQGPPKA